MCDESIKQKVLTAIHEHVGCMTCDILSRETGLATSDLFIALESLAGERKIYINIMPTLENASGHIPRSVNTFVRLLNCATRSSVPAPAKIVMPTV